MLFCALCCCRCLPKLKQFFFSDPEDRRGSNQRNYQPPAPNYAKSKSASICSVSQLPAGKRGSNAQHFQPVSIEVNQSSPTPPATNQPASVALSARRLSAINVSSINTSTSPTLTTNLNTISGVRVPYPRSPQPASQQQLRAAAVQSSGAINELGLTASPQSQPQVRTPRTRASISNLLMSPKLSTNFDYQLDPGQPANNNDFEFKNLNYSAAGGLRALSTGYTKQRRYSTAEAFATHTSPYLPSQLPKSRRHSRAVADIPSPSQYHNERSTLNRKKYSLANSGGGEMLGSGQLLINKTLVQAQQEHARKYSNSSSTPSSSRKQSRTDLAQLQQQLIQDESEQPPSQDYRDYGQDAYNDQFVGSELQPQYPAENYQPQIRGEPQYVKRHSASHQPQHYLPVEIEQQQTDYHQYNTGWSFFGDSRILSQDRTEIESETTLITSAIVRFFTVNNNVIRWKFLQLFCSVLSLVFVITLKTFSTSLYRLCALSLYREDHDEATIRWVAANCQPANFEPRHRRTVLYSGRAIHSLLGGNHFDLKWNWEHFHIARKANEKFICNRRSVVHSSITYWLSQRSSRWRIHPSFLLF